MKITFLECIVSSCNLCERFVSDLTVHWTIGKKYCFVANDELKFKLLYSNNN